jgi:predicted lipoprotein with Yx(FWY)xxD motif
MFVLKTAHFQLRSAHGLALLGAALFTACLDDEPGLDNPSVLAGSAGMAGRPSNAGAAATLGGTQNGAPEAGAAGAHGTDDPVAGSASGGMPASGSGGEAAGGSEANGGAGEAGESGVQIGAICPFHSEPVAAQGGAGGAGGAETGPSITMQLSPFVGAYLADAAGRALYTFGGDLPGDCNTPPQSLCVADCVVSWPPFDAGARELPEGLSDAGFGTIARGDGTHHTTYMGWPLYYYKSDLVLGQMTGQGKGKTWHVAEVRLPSVAIMKAGTIKYLADAAGRTLYVSAADQVGAMDSDPVSACSGECLDTFEPFHEKNLSVVTSLEQVDFSLFARHGAGGLQVAYKGMPLYRAATDLKAGDTNGSNVAGFTVALP